MNLLGNDCDKSSRKEALTSFLFEIMFLILESTAAVLILQQLSGTVRGSSVSSQAMSVLKSLDQRRTVAPSLSYGRRRLLIYLSGISLRYVSLLPSCLCGVSFL